MKVIATEVMKDYWDWGLPWLDLEFEITGIMS